MQFSSRRAARRELGDINVTSLVDIIFNLLLFFMLTTSFTQSAGLEVELPEASSADVKVRPDDLTVAVTRQGEIIVRGVVVSLPELEDLMKKHKQEHTAAALIVQADAEVPHGRVVEIVDAAKKQGFPRLGIAAQGGR